MTSSGKATDGDNQKDGMERLWQFLGIILILNMPISNYLLWITSLMLPQIMGTCEPPTGGARPDPYSNSHVLFAFVL